MLDKNEKESIRYDIDPQTGLTTLINETEVPVIFTLQKDNITLEKVVPAKGRDDSYQSAGTQVTGFKSK